MEEKTGLKGWFKLDHFDKYGNLIETVETPNGIAWKGFKEAVCLLGTDITSGHTAFDYIAVGTGTTAFTNTQTGLVTEITTADLARAGSTGTNITSTAGTSYDTFQLTHEFSVTTTNAVTESGVFNASSGEIMFCRQTFSAINVSSGDTLTITWKVKAAQG